MPEFSRQTLVAVAELIVPLIVGRLRVQYESESRRALPGLVKTAVQGETLDGVLVVQFHRTAQDDILRVHAGQAQQQTATPAEKVDGAARAIRSRRAGGGAASTGFQSAGAGCRARDLDDCSCRNISFQT